MANQELDAMAYIWRRLPKQRGKDGVEYIEYAADDLPFLYYNGFVDCATYTLEQWTKAFEPFKKAGGLYHLNERNFFSLRAFRYAGPVREPFDAMKIREGEWTEEELWKLYTLSISPSSHLTKGDFQDLLTQAQKKGAFKDGFFTIDAVFKARIGALIDKAPSPLRRLELRIAEAKVSEAKKRTEGEKSGFALGKNIAEDTSRAFSDLLTKR